MSVVSCMTADARSDTDTEEGSPYAHELGSAHSELEALRTQLRDLRRQLTGAERARLDDSREHNRRCADLSGELARVRAAAERAEAVRSQREVEVTRLRSENQSTERRYSDELNELQNAKESAIAEVSNLKRELEFVRSQAQKAGDDYDRRDRDYVNQIQQIGLKLEHYKKDGDTSAEEKLKLNNRLTKVEREHAETLAEVDVLRGKLEATQSQLDDCVKSRSAAEEKLKFYQSDGSEKEKRLESLEKQLAEERAEHLQLKFNSDLLAVRLTDLDSQVSTNQLREQDLTQALARAQADVEEQRHKTLCYRREFECLETETASAKACLQEDISRHQKDNLKLKKKLEDLEEVLNKIKGVENVQKTKIEDLDKSFKAFIRQVQAAVDRNQQPPIKVTSSSPLRTPKLLLDQLNKTLKDLRDQKDKSVNEMSELRKAADQHNAQLKELRENLWSKEKAFESLKLSNGQMQAEFKTAKDKLADIERRHCTLRGQHTENKKLLEKERLDHKNILQDLDRIVQIRKQEEVSRSTFLHKLCVQFGVEDVKKLTNAQREAWIWDKVSSVVREEKDLHDDVRGMREEVARLQLALHSAHKATSEEQARWRSAQELAERQKKELVEHYDRLVRVHTHTQSEPHEVNSPPSEIANVNTVKQTVPESTTKDENINRMLTCLAFLTSAHVPLARRYHLLRQQKAVLMNLQKGYELTELKLSGLAQVLDQSQTRLRGNRLRSAVFAVIAARRFTLIRNSGSIRISNSFWLGGTCSDSFNDHLKSWLQSAQLESVAESAVSEFSRKSTHHADLRVPVRQAITSLLSHLQPLFPTPFTSEHVFWSPPQRCSAPLADRVQGGVLALVIRVAGLERARELESRVLGQAMEEVRRLQVGTVPLQEHEMVMSELKKLRELERQQDSERFKQSEQVTTLTHRVDQLQQEDAGRSLALAQALQRAQKAGDQLRNLEHSEAALTRRTRHLESELEAASALCKDSEQRLADANRDREAAQLYLESVAAAVGSESERILLPSNPSSGPLLSLAQQAIRRLLTAHEQRLAEADEALLAHRKHIVQLRRQLQSA